MTEIPFGLGLLRIRAGLRQMLGLWLRVRVEGRGRVRVRVEARVRVRMGGVSS